METISGVFILVAVLGWVAGVVGLVRPELLADKKRGVTPSRKQIGLGMCILLLLFAMGGALLPDVEKPTKVDETADTPKASIEEPKLDIALADWIQQMNGQLKEVDRPALTVSTEQNTCDAWCTSAYESGKSVAYLVTHRNGRIHEITMIASGDGSFQSGGHIMLGLLSMTHVLSTGLSKQEISKSTMALLKDALDKGKGEATISTVRYSASKIDGMGLLFSASK